MSDSVVHDVVIIGAGPCGLAVAARLCEHTPSAIFTDEEHQRYHWIKKRGRQMSLKNPKTGQIKPAMVDTSKKYSTLVLDGTGAQWMTRWNNLFKTFEISHLRSPMFFHVCPSDRDALLSYNHESGQSGDTEEITGCVGKEVSKHQRKQKLNQKTSKSREVNINERDREDYFTPSQRLFSSHCECVIDRYRLRKGLVKQEAVQDIRFTHVPHLAVDDKVFTLQTDKNVHYARAVVLAVGAGNKPMVPGLSPGMPLPPQCCHSMEIQKFPDASITAKMAAGKETSIVVIGGGLTSAQLSDMAIRRGVTRVWHLMRGDCKVKPFDVDLSWMGKYKNLEQSRFWSADTDEERLQQIKAARGGGSITPAFRKILKKYEVSGRVFVYTNTVIQEKTYDALTKTWAIMTDPPIPRLPPIDYIYYATGISTEFASIPFLQSMLRAYPIQGHGGLPCLNDDLMWQDGVPLFVTGRLAGLRLGPGAGNLGGARTGAERIAWSIGDYLSGDAGKESLEDGYALGYASAAGNRYRAFSSTEEED